jgi:hypothetical protein
MKDLIEGDVDEGLFDADAFGVMDSLPETSDLT